MEATKPFSLGDTYEIYGEVGRGGLGTIFKARHTRLQKDVVIKRIDIPAASASDNRREADILKNLRHSYLPQVLDLICQDGVWYTVMDFIEGQSFQQLLDNGVIFTQAQAAKYGTQLLEALSYLHTQRVPVLHGDIKPANVMLTPEDNICLIDFNVSGFILGQKMITVGFTGGYAAPEQIRAIREARARKGRMAAAPRPAPHASVSQETETESLFVGSDQTSDETEIVTDRVSPQPLPEDDASMLLDNSAQMIDTRADLYSVGAFLYHLVTGRKPEANPAKQIPLSSYEGFSDAFAGVIDRAMRVLPAERFTTAEQMLKALRGYGRADKRYRHLKVRQGFLFAFLILGLGASVFFITFGLGKMRTENLEAQYQELLAAHEAHDEARFETLYTETVASGVYRFEAYREKALLLFEKRDYEGTVRFLTGITETEREEIAEIKGSTSQNDADRKIIIGDLYHVLGNSYLELGNVRSAEEALGEAVLFRTDDPSFFRDYALALAMGGNSTEAARILQQAQSGGLLEDQIALVRAEIAVANGDIESALRDFRYCADYTDDDYVRLRAYVLGAQAYDRLGNGEDIMREKIMYLERALQNLPQDQTMRITQMLAQSAFSLYYTTNDPEDAEKAITYYAQMKRGGADSVSVRSNLIMLFEREGRLDEALSEAQEMLETYPERYETYKRLARLEVRIQRGRAEGQRNYRTFASYYEMANEYYAQQMSQGQTDEEMAALQQEYEDVVSGGWLR